MEDKRYEKLLKCCVSLTGQCGKGGMRCPEGTCLSAEERCDGQFHCSDGSDEPITCGRFMNCNEGKCCNTLPDAAAVYPPQDNV